MVVVGAVVFVVKPTAHSAHWIIKKNISPYMGGDQMPHHIYIVARALVCNSFSPSERKIIAGHSSYQRRSTRCCCYLAYYSFISRGVIQNPSTLFYFLLLMTLLYRRAWCVIYVWRHCYILYIWKNDELYSRVFFFLF